MPHTDHALAGKKLRVEDQLQYIETVTGGELRDKDTGETVETISDPAWDAVKQSKDLVPLLVGQVTSSWADRPSGRLTSQPLLIRAGTVQRVTSNPSLFS